MLAGRCLLGASGCDLGPAGRLDHRSRLVFVESEQLATAFDDGASTWMIAIWISSAFWLLAGVLIAVAAGSRQLIAPSRRRSLGLAAVAVWFVIMTATAISLVAIPMAYSTQARDLLDGEGRIEILGETWCLSPEDGFERHRETDRCGEMPANDAN